MYFCVSVHVNTCKWRLINFAWGSIKLTLFELVDCPALCLAAFPCTCTLRILQWRLSLCVSTYRMPPDLKSVPVFTCALAEQCVCDAYFYSVASESKTIYLFFFLSMNWSRWWEGGAVHASGAALPAAQQQAPGPRGGDRRHAAVGGAGVAEICRGVQGHDRHQPRHGEASSLLCYDRTWPCLPFQGHLSPPNPDTAGIRLFLLACDMSKLTYYPQGRWLSSTPRAKHFMSQGSWLTFLPGPYFKRWAVIVSG